MESVAGWKVSAELKMRPKASAFVAAVDQFENVSVRGKYPYFLVDEILIIPFDTESPFHFLHLGSLFKEQSIHRQDLSPRDFPLLDHSHELASIFKLFP